MALALSEINFSSDGAGSGSDASCQTLVPDGAIQPSRDYSDWALTEMANLALVDIS